MTDYIKNILNNRNVPKEIVDKLESLTMGPGDWGDLDKILFYNDYRDVVNDYQHRQHQKLPNCTSIFKVCIYSHGGKCHGKYHCQWKK